MTAIKPKTKLKTKAAINNKARKKRRKKKKNGTLIEKINSKQTLIVAFFSGVLLIVSTYAWLSQSLNVQVKFFDLSVATDNGLFISLDGIEYSDSVQISLDSVINDLKATYPNHTNQWATGGLWPVSSNGIRNADRDKFDVFLGEMSRLRNKKTNRRFLNTRIINEDEPSPLNAYIGFDIFLKNVSGSPKSDNLYLDETSIDFSEGTEEEVMTSMTNIMNSMRFGIVRIGSVPSKTDVKTIQNLKCNNNCDVVIYEPRSTFHSVDSIDKLKEYGINITDGIYSPTYGVINEGNYLEHMNGQEGSGLPLDTEHFALQHAITSFERPIFQVPNGVTKLRVYVWIEGQDVDSLETYSKGAAIDIAINFSKDLAGYE